MIRETAYAKINLSLKIRGFREDGYHLLDMVLQTISLSDALTFEAKEKPGVRLVPMGDHPFPNHGAGEERGKTPGRADFSPEDFFGGDNLILKAVFALYEMRTGQKCSMDADFRLLGADLPGLEITLDKRIPIAAGLGGGSADAAAALRGVNRLYSLGLSPAGLEALGAGLGADIPFLIRGGTQKVRGIGELLSGAEPLKDGYFLIAKPMFGVSTPWAYGEYDRLGGYPDGENDLEKGVIESYPLIGQLKAFLLEKGAKKALMSGSGSAVFGYFATEGEAGKAGEALLRSSYAKELEGIFGAAPVTTQN